MVSTIGTRAYNTFTIHQHSTPWPSLHGYLAAIDKFFPPPPRTPTHKKALFIMFLDPRCLGTESPGRKATNNDNDNDNENGNNNNNNNNNNNHH